MPYVPFVNPRKIRSGKRRKSKFNPLLRGRDAGRGNGKKPDISGNYIPYFKGYGTQKIQIPHKKEEFFPYSGFLIKKTYSGRYEGFYCK